MSLRNIKRDICAKMIFSISDCHVLSIHHTIIFRTSILLNMILMLYLCMLWQPAKILHRKEVYNRKEPHLDNAILRRHSLDNFSQSILGDKIQFKETTLKLNVNSEKIQDTLEQKMYPNLRKCYTKPVTQAYYQKGDYWVLENYIPRERTFKCHRSITYTTHAEFTFMDNLDPLTARWQGPISIAVYCPGKDFQASIDIILHLRRCGSNRVKQFVSFHLFFPVNHMPEMIPSTEDLLHRNIDCNKTSGWKNVTTHRKQNKMIYPVNVARNIARANSVTYFNLPSDIELYPSVNFISDFFKMLKTKDKSNTTNPRVFVLPVFEISEKEKTPETKAQLQLKLWKKIAIVFHKYICPLCHSTPMTKEWQVANASSGLSVFHIAKRKRPITLWEPIYVGTNNEPIYDERLSWEGKGDKMTQMYVLCAKDYEFHILDNAFLVHKPGIKKPKPDPERKKIMTQQSHLITEKIFTEYKALYGHRRDCSM